jgi:hypothetical protein
VGQLLSTGQWLCRVSYNKTKLTMICRQGQNIGWHAHTGSPDFFVSGTFAVMVPPPGEHSSATLYQVPKNQENDKKIL